MLQCGIETGVGVNFASIKRMVWRYDVAKIFSFDEHNPITEISKLLLSATIYGIKLEGISAAGSVSAVKVHDRKDLEIPEGDDERKEDLESSFLFMPYEWTWPAK